MATTAPPLLVRTTAVLDGISLWSGRVVACLIVPMVLGLTYEVVARYVFNAPTVWAYDMTFMLFGTFFMLGSAYTLMRKGHIRTDTFYANWSPRVQGTVDAVCYVILLPVLIIFLWVGWGYFARSFAQGERIVTSPWMPIVYPFKFVIPLTALLLILQSTSELLKSLWAARTGEWP
jgi:TRAP-type mannitol/chloroaromatic compound transport system permease small subunit